MFKDKIVSFYAIGAGSDASVRKIQYDIPRKGWFNFLDKYASIDVSRGYDRPWLHNPFGNKGNMVNMSFDQIVETEEALSEPETHAGLRLALESFAPAWEQFLSSNAGTVPTSYVGKLVGDTDFIASSAADWLDRFYRSLAPFIRLGMNVAFDASANAVEPDSPELHGMNLTKSLLRVSGRSALIEPWPKVGSPVRHFDIFILDDSFQTRRRQLRENPKAAAWATPESEIQGEIVRLVLPLEWKGESWANRDSWIFKRVGEILRDGHSPALNLAFLRNAGALPPHDELVGRCLEASDGYVPGSPA